MLVNYFLVEYTIYFMSGLNAIKYCVWKLSYNLMMTPMILRCFHRIVFPTYL
jgi:hypothetical protein